MAHANPEFALGLMQRDHAPVRHQLPGPASLAALRARMREIGDLLAINYPVSPEEREAYRLWLTTVRQQRAINARGRSLDDALTPAGGAMHGGEPKVRFVPPTPRGQGTRKLWAQS